MDAGPVRRMQARPCRAPLRTRTPRIAKDAGKFNGGCPAPKWRRGLLISLCVSYGIAAGAERAVPCSRPRLAATSRLRPAGRMAPERGRQREGTHAVRAPARRIGRCDDDARAVV